MKGFFPEGLSGQVLTTALIQMTACAILEKKLGNEDDSARVRVFAGNLKISTKINVYGVVNLFVY